ncbi:Hsp70 family protein [Streptomyces xiamenensis]|uniref:Hsp70 family protein n=1 Tax=Streptomyces xiamenensis TaxID=408015 RepID=UPI0037D969D5
MEPLRAGDPETVGGFVLRGRLGAGGMGEVFLGRSPGGRAAAVKVVHPHLAGQGEFRRRFTREVAAARAVGGAFTAPVMAAGPQDDRPWIATVYIPGPDLAQAVGVAGPLPQDAVWRLAAGLVEALQDIHAVGVLHRDLKPSNVLVAADGPRVIDFGIVRTLEDTALTATGLVVGTAGFMAPEQAEGDQVGPAGDVFALGAVIAFAATAAGPFGEGPPLAVLHRVVNGRPRLDGLTGPLRELVDACLAKDPRERPTLTALLERIGAHWEPADDFPGGSPWPDAVTTRIQRHATPPTAPYTEAAEATAPRDGGPHATRRAVGIDFGTTNSAIAVMEGGEVSLIPNAHGAHTTPSLVALTVEGDALVGTAAERQALTHPGYAERAAKLKLGTDWRIARGDVRLTAEDVAGLILARLRQDAEAYLGEPVTDVVLAVPAGFRRDQRAALVRAGERAGLNVLRLINEPSAAAMAYGPHQEDRTVLIFDLGAGTLDVSLIELGDGVVEIKATAGEGRLGGNDWDQRIVEHLTDRVRRRHGVDLTGDVAAAQRLREAAETAKIDLSAARTTTLRLPYLATGADGPIHLEEELTRQEFETLTQDLLERCRALVERVLADAEHTPAYDIDQVVLTGGAARMPAVGDVLRRLTGSQGPCQILRPEAVAHGAVFEAGVLTGAVKDVLLLDVAPHSIGIETNDGTTTKLLPRNETIPTKRSDLFTTHTHDQPKVVVHIVEGEREDAARNRTLAVLELALPPAPRGVPLIEVTADCDANDILHIKVKDLGTGNATATTIDQATMERAAALLRSSHWASLRDLAPATHPAT